MAAIGAGDTQSTSIKHSAPASASSADVELAKCDCCGLMEECTPAYIAGVRERYGGPWICGLCGEAIKDESSRSQKDIGTAEAFERHRKFYQQFKLSTPPANPTENLISAIRRLLKRSLDSPRKKKGSVFPSSSSSSP